LLISFNFYHVIIYGFEEEKEKRFVYEKKEFSSSSTSILKAQRPIKWNEWRNNNNKKIITILSLSVHEPNFCHLKKIHLVTHTKLDSAAIYES
jgi:hypothetical protein